MAEGPGTDLSVMPEHGTTALVRLDPATLQAEAKAIREIQKSVLVVEVDYGIIPGTKKPSLYKPGAEVLLKWAQMGYRVTVVETDRDPAGMKYGVTYRCTVHRLDAPDVVIAEADGYCGYDEVGRDAHTITYQDSGRTKEVPKEPWNTIVAMAVKRAMVAATRAATGTSGIFTQDVEDPAYRARNGADEDRGSNGGGQRQGEFPMITAKFPSTCVVCKQPIAKGETIVYDKVAKKAWHPTCDPRSGDGTSTEAPAEGEPPVDAEPQDDTAPAPAAEPGKMQPGQRKVLVDLVQAIAKMTGNKALTEAQGLQQIGNAVGIDNLDGWAFDNWTEAQAKEAILALTKEMNDFLAAQKAAKEATNG
jgi:hypothetical protein